MKLRIPIILFSILITGLQAIGQWTYTELAPLPEPIANNAITSVEVDRNYYVYSFAGIDSTKLFSGIHTRVYKYEVAEDRWTALPDLPNGGGRIAAGASSIGNEIYVVGGYEVFANGSERSFNTIHIFDVTADTFKADAIPMPVPIDDHVQVVRKDSLLYTVTGWSNTANVTTIQYYSPQLNDWTVAFPVPANNDFTVFGGSGVMIGDTIYYAGGAANGGNFPATSILRKGHVVPTSTKEILWMSQEDLQATGYRMAASSWHQNPIWIGGSDLTYNFDGIAYNGSGGVSPFGRVKMYDVARDTFIVWENVFPPHMDFRGVGKISKNEYIIAGGMSANQEVSDRVFLLTYHDNSGSIDQQNNININVYPNPIDHDLYFDTKIIIKSVEIFNASGAILEMMKVHNNKITWNHGSGLFYIDILLDNGRHVIKKLIKA